MSDPILHHVGISVSDLDDMVAFYRDILGLAVTDRFSVAGDAFERGVGVPGASGEFVHLEGQGCRIELVNFEPSGTDRATGSVTDPGATHVGLAVEDLDAVYEGLPAAVEPTSAPQTTASGTRILFVRDPEGNLVELLEP